MNNTSYIFKPDIIYESGPGISVGIATDYGLDGPGSNPTILPLASAKSSCGTMGVISICNIPNKPPARPDAIRPNGLPETI